jgi:hypothetical protein
VAYLFIYSGAAFIITAGLAWSAVASRSEFVTYCVSVIVILNALVWVCDGCCHAIVHDDRNQSAYFQQIS